MGVNNIKYMYNVLNIIYPYLFAFMYIVHDSKLVSAVIDMDLVTFYTVSQKTSPFFFFSFTVTSSDVR